MSEKICPRELEMEPSAPPAAASSFDALRHATDWCDDWLRFCCDARPYAKLAAVFDIDATLLSRGERIEEVCALFGSCVAMGVTPFVVTARSEAGREFTEAQLDELCLGEYKRLFMHPQGTRCTPTEAGARKRYARDRIGQHDFTIVLNCGDAFHDHFCPQPRALMSHWGHDRIYVFISDDGVAHLKLPG